jgi:ubiquinone/menaquinone biosynthesis C-methylase UbiE/uncharacterized protein YbaR (Trm112 family)
MALLKKELLDILICPVCGSGLQLQVLSEARKDGILRCKNEHSYPVINGLPKILVEGLEGDYSDFVRRYNIAFQASNIQLYSRSQERVESRQVQETYREKWTSKDIMGIGDSSPFKQFIREWGLRRYGWSNEDVLSSQIRHRRLILDAGAGLGRETIRLAQAAPESTVVGLEFSDCAENALKNIASVGNAHMVQGDIMRMPFNDELFDFILSDGVLHHTPNTREALAKCCRVLKKGGEIAFYIYRKKGPLREFADDYLRQVMQRLSTDEKWLIARKLTALGKALAETRAIVKIPEDIPELGIKKGEINVQRFVYWNFLKCFWNDTLPLDENVIINFDWYAPVHGHRHTEEEIRRWCRENSLEIIWFYAEESGYTIRAIKKT